MIDSKDNKEQKPELCVVFGATGMLGKSLVEQLLDRGKRVRVFIRKPIVDDRVEQVIGDIRDEQDIRKAVKGADVVFQMVAVIDWNPQEPDSLFDVNVKGNHHVIEACIDAGVRKFVYTSSMDVVFDGNPLYYVDETAPYPETFLEHYAYSKALAEQETIAANGKNGMLTCSLRPVGIYGADDRIRFPTVIEAIRKGSAIRMGNGSALMSNVYVENCAHAHVLAAENLEKGSPVGGQCYFITDGYAINFFSFVLDDVCAKLGYHSKYRRFPHWLVKIVARLWEWWNKITRKKEAPLLTRYIVAAVCSHFCFTHEKATRDFGYEPIVGKEEAIERTVEGLRARGFAKQD